MLYRAGDFEPLAGEPWDEERIRTGIREIVADTDAALRGPKPALAFACTGDERWLDRARRVATYAPAQVRRERAARGRGRYSLLTGDPGVTLYPRTASTRVPRTRCWAPDYTARPCRRLAKRSTRSSPS